MGPRDKQAADAEQARLAECKLSNVPWKKWGPYLSERQWGTVREDYSKDGNAWDYFTHDQARSRAYRWGEDGIAGLCDEKQRLCFALALWNGRDPFLKERLFGLTNSEGNHGEDVKEYYFYLDSTPTHSYMKFLYRYPQAAYPYADLIETNRRRTRFEQEYELIDTGVFDDDRYFDILVEYAKADPEDILVRVSAVNRGAATATIHLLPTLWFRNTWTYDGQEPKPRLTAAAVGEHATIAASHQILGSLHLYCDTKVPLLFTENVTNNERIFGARNTTPYVKDGINNYVVSGRVAAVNPRQKGTKASAHYELTIGVGESATIRLRLRREAPMAANLLFDSSFDALFERRIQETDDFYAPLFSEQVSEEDRMIARQSLAGMLWTKQYYYFDLDRWLREHGYDPTHPRRNREIRNIHWFHMMNDDVISMPDKWEYPWYAAWDLAFHAVALAMVDVDFAKEQLDIMLREPYLHPSGQIPAYEWNFSDVNPPVHAWATLYVYEMEKAATGNGDLAFLEISFRKLMLNFTWWVNRKDRSGRNLFEGGFLGLDNIGVFDRSASLPGGGHLEQADGTAWMAMFCQTMLSIALELAAHDPSYERMARKFVDHFLWIAGAMDREGDHEDELWDSEDGFFYDLLYSPDGSAHRLKVRSMVGLLPLCAVSVISEEMMKRYPSLMDRIRLFFDRRPELAANLHEAERPGYKGRYLLSVLNEKNLRRVLARMLDEDQFLSKYGVRSLSKAHQNAPYIFHWHGDEYRVAYEPAESSTNLFGGNSNWRGPVWFPVNALIIKALVRLYLYYGDSFTVECPTGSGLQMNLFDVAQAISCRLTQIFRRDQNGRRPVFGGAEKFQTDPYWRDHILFYEFFHGDNGAGIGASHQTGWTGLVARGIQLFGLLSPSELLAEGGSASFRARRDQKIEVEIAGR
ncbi:MAG: glucosidase [Acidobacteriaceae bacterium]|nr:glucosidase [Acidobacteriaceae bacterium]